MFDLFILICVVISIREREITLKTDEWSEKVLKGLLFTNCVIQSKVGKMFFRTLLGESLLALFFSIYSWSRCNFHAS